MNILAITFIAAIVCLCCLTTTQQEQEAHNVTQWAKSREKRFLIFPTLGVHKFVVSFVLSIDLNDKKAWRSLAGAWAFQWQHNLPLTVLKWWNSTYFPVSSRSNGEEMLLLKEEPTDMTATFLYAMIESYMDQKGINGRQCMQRAICENAQVEYVGGVLDRIYQRFLTPERAMDDVYHDSFAAGSSGVDCFKTYLACPKGESVFDKYVYITDIN